MLISLVETTYATDACYSSFKKLQKKTSSSNCTFEKATPINANNKGIIQGETYFYKRNDKNSLNYASQAYVGIVHQDSLYLNCDKLGIGTGFAKVLSQGKYYIILAAIPQKKSYDLDLTYVTETGTFEPKKDAINIRQFMMYAIDAQTFKKTALTFAGMLKLTAEFPELQLKYVKDPYNDQWSTTLEYIQQLEVLEQQ